MERQEAVFRWMVRYVAPELPDRLRRRMHEVLPMPPRVRRERRRWGDWLVRRVATSVLDRQTVAGLLFDAMSEFTLPLMSAAQPRDVAGALERMVRETGLPGVALQAEWALCLRGQGACAAEAMAMLPADLAAEVDQLRTWIVEDEERVEAERVRAVDAHLRARETATRSVAAAEREAKAAKAEAARQLTRATRAGRTAAEKVAEAQRRCTDLEARVVSLEQLLEERDRLLADVVRSYEERLHVRTAEPRHLPLDGLRLLVVGDTPRAAAYRACASALGAREVRFVEGMDLSESALAAAVSGCDLVATVVAHARHSALEIVRRHGRSGTRLVWVARPGLAAFRRVLSGAHAAG